MDPKQGLILEKGFIHREKNTHTHPSARFHTKQQQKTASKTEVASQSALPPGYWQSTPECTHPTRQHSHAGWTGPGVESWGGACWQATAPVRTARPHPRDCSLGSRECSESPSWCPWTGGCDWRHLSPRPSRRCLDRSWEQRTPCSTCASGSSHRWPRWPFLPAVPSAPCLLPSSPCCCDGTSWRATS